MFDEDLNKIIEKIKEKSGLDEKNIKLKISQKIENLSGLVSEVGAAYIIANELGLKLVEGLDKGRILIKNLISGLKNIEIMGRVTKIWAIKEWEKQDKKGKIASLLVTDETGSARIILWNEKTEILSKIKEGDIVKVRYGDVRKGIFDNYEIHLKNSSIILINPEDKETTDMPELTQQKIERKQIKNLELGFCQIRATVVHIFNNLNFFDSCPICGLGLKKEDKRCIKHGLIENPKKTPVLNIIVDDGTGTLRAIFFGKMAEDFFKKYDVNIDGTLNREETDKILGREFIFEGKVETSSFSGMPELTIKNFYKPEPIEEAKKLLK